MSFPGNKTVIMVAGPTAVGKSAVAMEIAESFSTEIISADSRQCYKELNIGVARPSPEDLQKIKHYFIASHSIHQEVNAADFEKYAIETLNELFQSHDVVVMTGGTGLYIRAFCEGLDEIPPVSPAIRERISMKFAENGLPWLQEEIKSKDPEFYKMGEIQNPQRLMRALEVIESSGLTVLHFRKGKKIERDFNILKFGLELPKEQLHHNISVRTDWMIEQNLVEEVESLQAFRHLNALQTVGYTEIFKYLDKKISLEQAVNTIKVNTRHYAKRQMTWFRKDPQTEWIHPSETGKIKEAVQNIAGNKFDAGKAVRR